MLALTLYSQEKLKCQPKNTGTTPFFVSSDYNSKEYKAKAGITLAKMASKEQGKSGHRMTDLIPDE